MPTPPTTDLQPWFRTVGDVQDEGPLAADGRIDWPQLFGHDDGTRPVELDVGCGRGLFLFNASTSTPGTDWLGLEIDYKEGRRTARRLHKRQQPNARVVGGDAREFLRKLVRPASVDRVHVYFPDPWWKRRHRRRRLFDDTFLDLVATVLKPRGQLLSRTDVEDYWQVISALVDHDRRFERLPTPELNEPTHDLDYTTSFERKKRQAGETIYLGSWTFLGPPAVDAK